MIDNIFAMLKKRPKIENNSNDEQQSHQHQQQFQLLHHRYNQVQPLQQHQLQLQQLNQMQIDRPFNMNERIVTVLDQLDTKVEKLRKEALGLQEKRDFLLMSIDLLKHNEILQSMNEYEREEITCYIHRVNSRLSTIELNVKTVRDRDQEESLSQVNTMIDSLITSHDPVMSRQRCTSFLNACGAPDPNSYYDDTASAANVVSTIDTSTSSSEQQSSATGFGSIFLDKKFESALLGCTLDDQKNIKKRLLALMDYLNRQTISD